MKDWNGLNLVNAAKRLNVERLNGLKPLERLEQLEPGQWRWVRLAGTIVTSCTVIYLEL